MNFCSFFIKNKALFGAYPTQNNISELENNGVRYFINLTFPYEPKISQYYTIYNYISFPISDNKIPVNWYTFSRFIVFITNIIQNLKEGQLVYIHCKAGLSRSILVCSCILCLLYGISPEKSIEKMNKYRNRRQNIKDKWKIVCSPHNLNQRYFIYKFNKPLFIYRTFYNKYTNGFSLSSNHPIIINQEITTYLSKYKPIVTNELPYLTTVNGTFPTAQSLLDAYKDPLNKKYIQSLKLNKNLLFTPLTNNIISNWNEIKRDLMLKIIIIKLEQYPDIKLNLLNTGLRPIIYHSKVQNELLGELLTLIRNVLYQL